MSGIPHNSNRPQGLTNPGVLDAFAHDTRSDTLVLAMYEYRPWSLGESQLLQLQEKLNAYLSFLLDGEMVDQFPQLQDKPIEIQLRTVHEPTPEAWELISRAREQLGFQKISFEVIQISEAEEMSGGCGSPSCCGGSACQEDAQEYR